jgi:ATP-dependent Lon protease
MGGMEYRAVNFSYTDLETKEEVYVTVPEEAEDTLIPQGTQRPGTVYTIGEDGGRNSVFRLETQALPGTGKSNTSGVPGSGMKEDFETAYDFLKANMHELSPDESLDDHNVNVQVLNPGNANEGEGTSVAFLVGIISGILDRPVRSGLVVLGETSLMGELVKVNSLVDKLQLASDAGAKQVLLPTENKDDLGKVPNELLDELELLFYRDPINAASKAMDIE